MQRKISRSSDNHPYTIRVLDFSVKGTKWTDFVRVRCSLLQDHVQSHVHIPAESFPDAIPKFLNMGAVGPMQGDSSFVSLRAF